MVGLEERIARLEGRVDEHSRFFESISVKLTLLEERIDRSTARLEERDDQNRQRLEEKIELNRKEIELLRKELEGKMETWFRWIVGIQLTTWITVLLAILFK